MQRDSRAPALVVIATPPSWLGSLDAAHLRAIVVLDDDRFAALLALDALRTGPP